MLAALIPGGLKNRLLLTRPPVYAFMCTQGANINALSEPAPPLDFVRSRYGHGLLLAERVGFLWEEVAATQSKPCSREPYTQAHTPCTSMLHELYVGECLHADFALPPLTNFCAIAPACVQLTALPAGRC